MTNILKKITQTLFRNLGYEIIKHQGRDSSLISDNFPADFEEFEIQIVKRVTPYTMTSPERIVSLIRSIQYIVKNNIPGDIVECGVWKGGSMMAAAMALLKMNDTHRNLFLFDTFEGMSSPSITDISYKGDIANDLLKKNEKEEESYIWAYAPMEKVKQNLLSIGYPESKIHFIKGKIEETVPRNAPEKISLLRLDTDWYESTYHELTYLYPKLSHGGVIIIDDYGHWQGAKKATDEYIEENNIRLFLNRIDYTGRTGIKQ